MEIEAAETCPCCEGIPQRPAIPRCLSYSELDKYLPSSMFRIVRRMWAWWFIPSRLFGRFSRSLSARKALSRGPKGSGETVRTCKSLRRFQDHRARSGGAVPERPCAAPASRA
jgi:hypothetical protein